MLVPNAKEKAANEFAVFVIMYHVQLYVYIATFVFFGPTGNIERTRSNMAIRHALYFRHEHGICCFFVYRIVWKRVNRCGILSKNAFIHHFIVH